MNIRDKPNLSTKIMPCYEGLNRQAINYLKTIYFDEPEWTPCRVGLMPSTWMKYRDELEDIVISHPQLFPSYQQGVKDFDETSNPLYEPGLHLDCWGTLWKNIKRGLDSHPVGFPLESWSDLENYKPPNPSKDDMFAPWNWKDMSPLKKLLEREEWGYMWGCVRCTYPHIYPRPSWQAPFFSRAKVIEIRLKTAKENGKLISVFDLPHGFMYLRLCNLRGFENLMMDLATHDPRLTELIQIVELYNTVVIEKLIELGVQMFSFGDDLGLQSSLPMSPNMLRKFIKPPYKRMFIPIREAGIPIYLHTDEHIVEIIPDLIDVGVTVLNPQIRANGSDPLDKFAKGKIALDLDLDRQLFPFATPSVLEDQIHKVYEALYLSEGGLMLYAECEPDVPLENIETICKTLEKIGAY